MFSVLSRTGLAAAAVLLAPLAAHAADLQRGPYKAPAYVAPAYANWTGFYAGINAGYGFGKSNWDVPAVSPTPKGFVGGVTLGFNYQTGVWVWGLEGDVDYSDMKGDTTCGAGTCETKNSWLATTRGRIGYAGWNNFLPYITGGAAFGDIKATSPSGSASKTNVGWTVGGGLEYAMWSNWSVKAEYLYYDLGTTSLFMPDLLGRVPPTFQIHTVDFKGNIARGGVNYRFGG
jgi:outer membrane immunogenic protein